MSEQQGLPRRLDRTNKGAGGVDSRFSPEPRDSSVFEDGTPEGQPETGANKVYPPLGRGALSGQERSETERLLQERVTLVLRRAAEYVNECLGSRQREPMTGVEFAEVSKQVQGVLAAEVRGYGESMSSEDIALLGKQWGDIMLDALDKLRNPGYAADAIDTSPAALARARRRVVRIVRRSVEDDDDGSPAVEPVEGAP